MSAALELLRELEGLGLTIEPRPPSYLLLRPTRLVTPEVIEKVRANKPALLLAIQTLLTPFAGTAAMAWPPAWRSAWAAGVAKLTREGMALGIARRGALELVRHSPPYDDGTWAWYESERAWKRPL